MKYCVKDKLHPNHYLFSRFTQTPHMWSSWQCASPGSNPKPCKIRVSWKSTIRKANKQLCSKIYFDNAWSLAKDNDKYKLASYFIAGRPHQKWYFSPWVPFLHTAQSLSHLSTTLQPVESSAHSLSSACPRDSKVLKLVTLCFNFRLICGQVTNWCVLSTKSA